MVELNHTDTVLHVPMCEIMSSVLKPSGDSGWLACFWTGCGLPERCWPLSVGAVLAWVLHPGQNTGWHFST